MAKKGYIWDTYFVKLLKMFTLKDIENPRVGGSIPSLGTISSQKASSLRCLLRCHASRAWDGCRLDRSNLNSALRSAGYAYLSDPAYEKQGFHLFRYPYDMRDSER